MLDKFKSMFFVLSIVYIVLGLILIIAPQTSVAVICYILGGAAILYGLFHIISYLSGKDAVNGSSMGMVKGLIALFIGIFMLIRPSFITNILPVIIGLAILIDGIYNVQLAFDLKRGYYDKWFVPLITAIITIILALIIIFNPAEVVETVMVFVGISLVFDGATNIWSHICIKNQLK